MPCPTPAGIDSSPCGALDDDEARRGGSRCCGDNAVQLRWPAARLEVVVGDQYQLEPAAAKATRALAARPCYRPVCRGSRGNTPAYGRVLSYIAPGSPEEHEHLPTPTVLSLTTPRHTPSRHKFPRSFGGPLLPQKEARGRWSCIMHEDLARNLHLALWPLRM